MFRIGIDIGGTFTDFAIIGKHGNVEIWKEPSRPSDPMGAVLDGLKAVARNRDVPLETLLDETRLLVHGTTVATNTVIERSGPKTGLICTRGFRDVLYLRDAFKPERFNIRISPPAPFVDRYLRIGVSERIWSDGSVVTPLDEQEVRGAARHFREQGVEAVAVALLWSIVNEQHERRVAEILREELPGCYVVCSADVLPEIREWERTSATVLSAYVLPGIDEYFGHLKQGLQDGGLDGSPLIMQLNGGCAPIEDVLRRPVHVLHSGPAAAPAAALHHAARRGVEDLISVDMGGTSFDVCVIRGGQPARSRTMQVEMQPVGVAGVDVHSIGAGGGSIAYVDSGSALKVGPRSAGSVPGPAAYGLGADEPTVTDANIVLGYLDPEAFLGGRRTLRADLARGAVERHVATPLGLDLVEAAAGIVKVVNTNMAAAIRAVSVERGYDPRAFVLLCGGGAGGLHASALARNLGIAKVMIPREAGTLCAFGMGITDVRHNYVKASPALSSTLAPEALQEIFAELEDAGRERLLQDGFSPEEIAFERHVDARYSGQVHELIVPVPRPSAALTRADIDELEQIFHDAHLRQFNYCRTEMPVELLHWRLDAIGRMPLVDGAVPADESQNGDRASTSAQDPADARIGFRELYVPASATLQEVEVYKAEELRDGAVVTGPAVIVGETTTILLDEGDRMTCGVDSFLLEVGASGANGASAAEPGATAEVGVDA